jgi:hypothetical protein
MTIVDHMEQDIGGILSVGEVPDLVDDQDVRMGVGQQGVLQLPSSAGVGEIFDQLCGMVTAKVRTYWLEQDLEAQLTTARRKVRFERGDY